jgi:hypothetical protein
MKNLIAYLTELGNEKIKLSERAGSPIITTTQRSEIKNGFMNALMQDLQEATDTAIDENVLTNDVIIGLTADGVVLALEHKSIKKGNGEIPFKIEVKIGNLDYNTASEIEALELEKAEKEADKEAKAKAKAQKIAYDKNKREMKAKADEINAE